MRVLTGIDGHDHDVLNGEFASGVPGPAKFSMDHRKVLREAKVILNNIADNHFMLKNEVRCLVRPSFQATVLDGLYTA
ncbi:hypothetical protein DFQ28_001473, partial [Apophysomyces sp. BC1034]